MPTKWHHAIRKSNALIDRIQPQITDLLWSRDLTAEHAIQLLDSVRTHVANAEEILEELERMGASDDVVSEAERLDDRWQKLATDISDRLKAFRPQ